MLTQTEKFGGICHHHSFNKCSYLESAGCSVMEEAKIARTTASASVEYTTTVAKYL